MKGTRMRRLRRWAILVIPGLAFGLPFVAQNASSGQAKETAVRVALSRALPMMKGDGLKVTVLEVAYAPGAASSRHSHPCPVVGYVVAGAVRMQVKGEPEAVYKSGDTFRRIDSLC